ncbi:unnamed protein product [Caenorhabditis angaria]|uniref:Acyltransferase n=1 Tax=Caenorhabditis angaria TaxID=860376 RepID=A0A9P1IYI6_9PELO|nr:unnamed protein product [Caenorhabditis angaria]
MKFRLKSRKPIETKWLAKNSRFKSYLEVLSVMFFIFIWVVLPIMCLWVPFYLLKTKWWFLVPSYAVWFIYDLRTPRRGSRPWKWLREHQLWRHFADYFPLKLIKTAELSPERNYIIGSHPHGMFSIGGFTSMATTATGFHKKYPGMTPHIMTLNGQFYFPLRREFGMLLGGVEVSKESLEYLLTRKEKGKVCTIVVGGAMEALEAKPDTYICVLKNRKGFCKYAIMYGADLVPMYNFGENDLYEQYDNRKGTVIREVQEKICKVWGLCPPFLRGRSILNQYMIGLLPFRKPITSVIGKPIRVTQCDSPTQEQIDELHAKYCESLYKLFEDHKHRHNIASDVHLEFQ